MATNVNYRNASVINTIRVVAERFIPAVQAKAPSKTEEAVRAAPARWEKISETMVKPGESTAAWIAHANQRIVIEEIPT